MVGMTYEAPASRREQGGDDVVFRCSAFALGCGAVAAAAAAFGCSNQVLALLAPELSWLLLAPSLLVVLVAAVGLCASCRLASKLFRAQLAAFLLVFAAMLAGAGTFAYVSADAAADSISQGCTGYLTVGLWDDAGRLKDKMRMVSNQYKLLKGGWVRCRALNPLVYDLSNCGVRAECEDGSLASQNRLYSWFQHVQLTFVCGGFCDEEVPLFGSENMRETLETRTPCAEKVADSVRSLGKILSVVASIVALPVAAAALALSCAASRASDEADFQEVELSDPDDNDSDPGGYGYS